MKTFKKTSDYTKKTFTARPAFGARKPMRAFDESAERHQATCSACGKACEVPFKPNGKKPVYCRDCFRGKEETVPSSSLSGFRSEGHGPNRMQAELVALNVSIERLTAAVEAQTRALSATAGKKK